LSGVTNIMPFKSEKQRRWMHANKPEMAKKWEEEKKNLDEKEEGNPWEELEGLVVTEKMIRKFVQHILVGEAK